MGDIIYDWLFSFWKPLPSDQPYQQRFYLIQSSAKFESPLIKRLPEVFQNILGKGAQRTDFINVSQFDTNSIEAVDDPLRLSLLDRDEDFMFSSQSKWDGLKGLK